MKRKSYRIAIGGFKHETNTFASIRSTFQHFKESDELPRLCEGLDIFEELKNKNIPITGFIQAAEENSEIEIEFIPWVWCSASPSGYVEDEAFEKVWSLFENHIRKTSKIDAIYLDLHGAMVTESYQDAEGELLQRIREELGRDIPVVISLDFHANITQKMIDLTEGMTVYRTYPHIDMAETGERAYQLMQKLLLGYSLVSKWIRAPFLMPLTAQGTNAEPALSLYAFLKKDYEREIMSKDIALGFPLSDIEECGPSVVVYGENQDRVNAEADALYQKLLNAERQFSKPLVPCEEAVLRAVQHHESKPILLADVQDNAGTGASSDTTFILRTLFKHKATKAIVGLIFDPEAVIRAQSVGVGQIGEFSVGGKAGSSDREAFRASLKVEALSDGQVFCEGKVLSGITANLGPTVLLRTVEEGIDISVIVTSTRMQCLDQNMMRHIGVKLEERKIIVVKSTMHYRADFESIVSEILDVKAPGEHPCQLDEVKYINLRPNMRLC